MKVIGLIFSNIHDSSIPEMTARRTMASVPFGGRYRLIDFALSGMVNAGITKVGIVTHNNYRSLLSHIGTGKDWDLARRGGGAILLPPFVTTFENPRAGKLYSTRLEALIGVTEFLSDEMADAVVLSDCDGVCNVDLTAVLREHAEDGADLTVITKRMRAGRDADLVCADEDGNVTEFVTAARTPREAQDVNTNILVFSRTFLLTVIENAAIHGDTDFYRQALPRCMEGARVRLWQHTGYFARVNGVAEYFCASMDLLQQSVREELLCVPDRPILTKVYNSPPTTYGANAVVNNALIADGCHIEGRVENAILFRGVHVRRDAVVRDSILFSRTDAGEGVSLSCVIADKNVTVRDARVLSGHAALPFYIAKGKSI